MHLVLLSTLAAPALSAATPANDNLSTATVLSGPLPISVSGDTTTATQEPGEPQVVSNGNHSVWYLWTPTVTQHVNVTTWGPSFDTVIGVYTGSTTNSSILQQVAADDDYGGSVQSLVGFDAIAGTTYAIMVNGYSSSSIGSFTLVIEATPVYTVSVSNSPIKEGTGSALVTITGSVPQVEPVTVNLKYTGTAINGTDYATLPASVTIPAGATTTSLAVTPTNDGVNDGNEWMAVTVTGPTFLTPYVVGSPNTGVVVITDATTSIIYVNTAATGLNNGTSWTNAYTSLQTALAAATTNTQIWVAQGTYKPTTTTDRTISFVLKSGVALMGGFSGTEALPDQRNWWKYPTILSGDIGIVGTATDNSMHVVAAPSGGTLDGFIVRDGYCADQITSPAQIGAGIYISSTTAVTIKNCALVAGQAVHGGGIATVGSAGTTISSTVFVSNTATGAGGAMYNSGSSTLTLASDVFESNTAQGTAGGGAVYNASTNAAFVNCTFSKNSTTSASASLGGGAIADSLSSPTLANCILWGDTAAAPAGTGELGGTGAALAFTDLQGAIPAGNTTTSGISSDPLFFNPASLAGADGAWGTFDDGLSLGNGSPCFDAGTATPTGGLPATDVANRPRSLAAFANGVVKPDMGAYERSHVLYVRTTGSGDGTSWSSAFGSLPAALAYALPGDQIWVEKGTYTPGAARTSTFTVPPGIEIDGGFFGTEVVLSQRNVSKHTTILSGDIGVIGNNSDNCYNVVTLTGGTVDGFTIREGNANVGVAPEYFGAAIYASGNGVVRNCFITSNTAQFGAGIYAQGTVTVSNCVFDQNTATAYGGAAYVQSPSSFISCAFDLNTAAASGGGGGAIFLTGSSPNFVNCLFSGNSAGTATLGGGAAYVNSGAPIFQNCTFFNNSAAASAGLGGALYVAADSAGEEQRDCIFWGNTAGTAVITQKQVYSAVGAAPFPDFTFCDIQGGAPTIGVTSSSILSTDPIFVAPGTPAGADGVYLTNDDGLRLRSSSPCVDAGTATGAPGTDCLGITRPLGTAIDMGCYEGKVPTVTFAAASGTGVESVISVSVPVQLSAASDQTVTLQYMITGGTATDNGIDYSLPGTTVIPTVASSQYTSTNIATIGTLTFPAGTTAVSLPVTVTNDPIAEDPETIVLTLLNPQNASLGATTQYTYTITSDYVAGVTITPSSGIIVNENGGTATCSVSLNTKPEWYAAVTVNFVSSDTTAGIVSPSSLTFTAANWNVAQSITITGVQDFIAGPDRPFTINTSITSNDPKYPSVVPPTISATSRNVDVAGITVSPTAGIVVNENGGTGTFSLVLTSKPLASVSVGLSSSDTTIATVSPASVTFTSANWNIPQLATITGVHDFIDTADRPFTIVTAPATSTDGTYNGMNPADVSATCHNVDHAGFLVIPTSGLITTELGGSATYTIQLTSKPVASLSFSLATSDPNSASASPTAMSFDGTNWNIPQTVTVTGRKVNSVAQGNVQYQINETNATSTDPKYNNLPISSVLATNLDSDHMGITVSKGALSVNESGTSDSYTVVLTSQPVGNVVITPTDPMNEILISPSTLTFTASNWNTPQSVTVTGQPDQIAQGTHSDTIENDISGVDFGYNALNPPVVTVTIADTTAAGIIITESGGSTDVTEGGVSTDTYTVALRSRPGVQPHLVTDLRPGSQPGYPFSSSPYGGVVVNGICVFSAYNPTSGQELWRSDGTTAGTTLLKKISVNSWGSNPQNFCVVGSTAFFIADDGVNGVELWKTDGTTAGTVLVRDINPGPGGSWPSNLVAAGGLLFFSAYDPTHGTELWVSDGTWVGTTMVSDIYAGANGSNPYGLTVVGSKMFFSAYDGTATRLWVSDGTAAGTTAVFNNSANMPFGSAGGLLFFTAFDSVSGFTKLYTSNGTLAGTSQVAATLQSANSGFATIGSAVVFAATDPTNGTELWKSDGTSVGTVLLRDIWPGASSGFPSGFTASGGKVLFQANDGIHGTEPWVTDGTVAGTVQLADVFPGSNGSFPSGFKAVGSKVVFSANDGSTGQEPWVSDGTPAGTFELKDIYSGINSSWPNFMAASATTVFFSADDGVRGTELWSTNGTTAGTVLVDDIYPGSSPPVPNASSPSNLTTVGNTVFFTAYTDTVGQELFESDGSAAGTVLVKDINPSVFVSGSTSFPQSSNPQNLVNLNGKLLFTANDGTNGQELWSSDGTAAGTVMVKDIWPGPSASFPQNLTVVGTKCFFTAYDGVSTKLWMTDGTNAGTVSVFANYAYNLVAFNGELFFVGYDPTHGYEPWVCTTSGTATLIVDLDPGAASSSPGNATASGGFVYFTGYDGTTTQLWKSDGTAAGTISMGAIGSASNLCDVNGTLFFTAFDGTHGWELWKSTGSAAGTAIVADIWPGANGSNPHSLVNLNGILIFGANDGTHGDELWRSDGTAVGTALIKDLIPGSNWSYPQNMTNLGGTVYFMINDPALGQEPWQTDGTAAGTSLVMDINPGPASSYPSSAAFANGLVFFNADDGVHGSELWCMGSASVTISTVITDNQTATTPTSLVFTTANWNVPQTFTVTAPDDGLYQPSPHNGIINHASASAGANADLAYSNLTPLPSVTVHITDADAEPTVAFTTAGASIAENSVTPLTATIQLSAPSGVDTIIPFSVSGTAAASDYTITPSPVTIPAGQTTVNITIQPHGDGKYGVNKTVSVTIGTPSNATIGAQQQYVGTLIEADPAPTVSFAAASQSIAENAGAPLTVTLQLSAASTLPTTAAFSVGGTAIAGTNYTLSASSPVIIPPGQTSASFTLTPIDDKEFSLGQTVVFSLTAVTNGSIGATGTDTVTITDVDPQPVVSFTTASQTVAQNVGTTTITAQLSPGAAGQSAVSHVATSIPFTLGGSTAVNGTDYTISASPLTIPPETASATITITVNATNVYSPNKTVVVTMGTVPTATIATNATHTATITYRSVGVSLSTGLVNVSTLGTTATYQVVLTSQPHAGKDVQVQLTKSGGQGLVGLSPSTLTFTPANWNVPQTVTVSASGGPVTPAGSTDVETIVHTIVPVTTDANLDPDYSTYASGFPTLHVTADVTSSGVLVITPAAGLSTMAEGGSATFNVHLSAPLQSPTGQVEVQFTTDGTTAITSPSATPPAVPTLTFASGNYNTDQTVTVFWPNDTKYEPTPQTSMITATILQSGSGYTVDAAYGGVPPSTITATMTTEASPKPTVSFGSATQSVSEAAASLTIPVNLSAISGVDTTVPYSLSGSAVLGMDYTIAPVGQVVIAAGTTSASITLTPILNPVKDPDVQAILTIGVPTNATVGATGVDTVTITDDKTAPAIVAFAAQTQNVLETGSPLSATVTISPPYYQAVDIDFTVSGTAASGTNYSMATTSPVHIPAGATSVPITINPIHDNTEIGPLTVVLDLTSVASPTNGDVVLSATAGATRDTVTIGDVDVAGVTVSKSGGGAVAVTEGGAADFYQVVLNTKPLGPVTISLTPADAELQVAPTSLTFTTANWNTPQTVTVTAPDDFIAETPSVHPVMINYGMSSGADAFYAGLAVPGTPVTVTNVDTVGLVLTHAGPISLVEGGASDTYTVALASKPTANVQLTLTPDPQLTPSPLVLNFTPANWNTPQTVTISAPDDSIIQSAPDTAQITYAGVGGGYGGASLPSTTVTITDTDHAGIVPQPASGLTTTIHSGVAVFSVTLTSKPLTPVTIALASSDTTQGTVSPSSLAFTPANWNVPHLVQVTGVASTVASGNVSYTVTGSVVAGSDSTYTGLTMPAVTVVNVNDNVAAVLLAVPATRPPVFSCSPTTGTTAGGTSVTITGANFTGATSVTFGGVAATISSVSATQIVAVTPPVATGSVTVQVTSPGGGLQSVNNAYAFGVVASPSAPTSPNSSTVTEGSGSFIYTIQLTSQPMGGAPVTISLLPDQQLTTSVPSVTFTSANWNVPQTVTVNAIDDQVAQPSPHNAVIQHTASGANYGSVSIPNLVAQISDIDVAGVSVSPTSGLTVSESGTTATFTERLTSKPTSNVTITLSPSDATHASVSPAVLTFTPSTWNTAQTVTITGVHDFIANSPSPTPVSIGSLASSSDGFYNGIAVTNVAATVTDIDSVGIVVNAANPLQPVEGGGNAFFTAVLASKPTGIVTIPIASSDLTQGTVSPSSLTFAPSTWNITQTVTVTAVDSPIADGNVPYSITIGAASSTDGGYNGLSAAPVAAANQDPHTAGVTITQPGGVTAVTEGGASTTYSMQLTSQPTGTVTITVTPDPTKVSVTPTTLTFTPANWNIGQSVSVSAIHDFIAEGPHVSVIAQSASGGGYTGVVVPSVNVFITDIDTMGVVCTPSSGLATTESGGSASYTVQLTSEPVGNVQIDLASSDTSKGLITAPNNGILTFTPGNWNVPQTVTITGQADLVPTVEGDVPYDITGAVDGNSALTTDPGYIGIPVPSVSVASHDQDTAAIAFSVPSGTAQTTEGQGPNHSLGVNVALTSIPAGTVTIGFSTDNPLKGSVTTGASLTFDASNWSQPQALTVTGIDNHIVDGNITYHLVGTVSSSGDPNYVAVSSQMAILSIDELPPVPVVNPAGLVIVRGTTNTITSRIADPVNGLIGATDAETPAPYSDLVFTLQLVPSEGVLAKHLVVGDAGVPLSIGNTFTNQDLANGLITYAHNGTPGNADGFAFTVTDDDLSTSSLAVLNIVIQGNNPPQITFNGTATWTEATPPAVVCPNAVCYDPDNQPFTNGSITITLNSTGLDAAHDLIGINNQGTGDGQIGVTGSGPGAQVTFGLPPIGGVPQTVVIGNIAATTTNLSLAIQLTPGSNNANVTALLRQLTFVNNSSFPSATDRAVTVTMNDGFNGIGTGSATVQVTPVADPPIVTPTAVLTHEGVPVSGVVPIVSPDLTPYSMAIATIPVKGIVVITNPATGAFTYTPFAGASGIDTFTVKATASGLTSAPASVTVTITGGAMPRPWIASRPPMEEVAGNQLSYLVTVDTSDMPNPPNLTFRLTGTPPAGMTITPVAGTNTAIVLWTVTLLAGTDYASFGIQVNDSANNASGWQPVLLKVYSMPGGGG